MVTELTRKRLDMLGSAAIAAAICGLTAYLGGAAVKVCVIGALLSLLKDMHSFMATSPKDLTP